MFIHPNSGGRPELDFSEAITVKVSEPPSKSKPKAKAASASKPAAQAAKKPAAKPTAPAPKPTPPATKADLANQWHMINDHIAVLLKRRSELESGGRSNSPLYAVLDQKIDTLKIKRDAISRVAPPRAEKMAAAPAAKKVTKHVKI